MPTLQMMLQKYILHLYSFIHLSMDICMCVLHIYTHIHIYGVLFSHKKEKSSPFVTTRTDSECIMPSEIDKDRYCMTPLYVESEKNELIGTESKMVVSRGGLGVKRLLRE